MTIFQLQELRLIRKLEIRRRRREQTLLSLTVLLFSQHPQNCFSAKPLHRVLELEDQACQRDFSLRMLTQRINKSNQCRKMNLAGGRQ